MHVGQLLRVISIILVIVCAFMLFPLAFALVYGETGTVTCFLIPIAVSIVAAATVFLFTRRARTSSLSAKDGFLLVTGCWTLAAAVGALPFWLSGVIPNYADAYFETMSGFTTTGASILTNIEALPKSMLFWRSLTHWLGGMGIVVLAAAILPLLGIGAYRLMKAEAPGPTLDKITPRVAGTAKILWLVYLFLTVAQTALLMAGGMDLFDALTHTFGTLATGGFSPKNASVGHYGSAYIDIVITLFMVMAGVNFSLYFRLIIGDLRMVARNTELRAYLAIFVVTSLILAIVLDRQEVYTGFGESLRYAAFQSATVLTTTGYVTADYSLWPEAAKIILFALMFVGGCSGSTGGSIKVIRIVTLAKLATNEMKYLAHPKGVFRIMIGGEPVKKGIVYTIAGFFTLYITLLLITSIVAATAGADLETSFTTALVTLGNIGPGFGAVGPVGNYAFYPDYVIWFLSFIMMAGRLEIYTVLILFTPIFWRRG
jgi:trk system potassium uptake protein